MKKFYEVYPSTPVNVPESVTELSSSFKKEIRRMVINIVLFVIIYLLLIAGAIGLTMGCVYIGWYFICLASFWPIVLGVGIICMGSMVLIFLIKFIFSKSSVDNSGRLEIAEDSHPLLYEFIRQLATDTDTAFPKRIFLSSDVNASVFYDSNFWSMFFPVKKNLEIGLGLVNALNLSEFKAVVAHEFGHFSQKSMKMGSFVYNVNKVIYNMLYENNGYGNFLRFMAGIGDFFYLFALVTSKIVTGIQWILGQQYKAINKSYMKLSREMEFHADAVSASVCGSKALVDALHRLEFADMCFNTMMEKYDKYAKEGAAAENIFPDHQYVMRKYAEKHKLPIENGLPVIEQSYIEKYNRNRVNYKDQWASHPSTNDREDRLLILNIKGDNNEGSAWDLFDNVSGLQRFTTDGIYERSAITVKRKVSAEEFRKQYDEDMLAHELPFAYKGFYDRRYISRLDLDLLINGSFEKCTWQDILSEDTLALPSKIEFLEVDIKIVKAIANKGIDVRTFDFDGKKYNSSEAQSIAQKLEQELEDLKTQLIEADRKQFLFFYHQAVRQGEEQGRGLCAEYKGFFALSEDCENYLSNCIKAIELFSAVYAGVDVSLDAIRRSAQLYRENSEPELKKKLGEYLNEGFFDNDPELKEKARYFLQSHLMFCNEKNLIGDDFKMLHDICRMSCICVDSTRFQKFKKLLESQLLLAEEIVENEELEV